MKTVVFAATLAIFGATSCGKENVALEKKNELANLEGKWTIQSVTTNGSDATASFTASNGSDYTLQINHNRTYAISGTAESRTTGTDSSETVPEQTIGDAGTWEIIKTSHDAPKKLMLKPSNGSSFKIYTIRKMCQDNLSMEEGSGTNMSTYNYSKQR